MTTTPLTAPQASPAITPVRPTHRWSFLSIAIITLAWLILQIGGLFTPGLLDDVDSIYIEVAREMLHRHDFITPYINGIRFFDKPPLMYWMAAGSMHLFGIHDWAARLPLALSVLVLFLAVYALGIRLFSGISPATHPDRGGFYAALALATSIGPYLYTRFYIPDILLALWMTLAVHLFLIALDRINRQTKIEAPPNRVPRVPILRYGNRTKHDSRVPHLRRSPIAAKVGNRESDPPFSPDPNTPGAPSSAPGAPSFAPFATGGNLQSPLLPCLAFAAVMALNVLTKGFIGLVFPIVFVLLYLAITKQLRLLPRFHLFSSTAVFLVIAAPWHVLAALRTPAIALPPGLGLPATGGWAWFYLFNEHIARFLGKRIPHDYGQVPVFVFLLLTAVWILPWAAFLPGAILQHLRDLFRKAAPDSSLSPNPNCGGAPSFAASSRRAGDEDSHCRNHEAALSLLLWAVLVLGFFSLSSRQEYYGIPALPALALMAAGLLARADAFHAVAHRSTLTWSLYFLVPLTTALAAVCEYFAITAPQPAAGTDIATLLAANPQFYNLSLGHIFDLTGAAMGLFRGPLTAVTLSMMAIGLGSYLLRRAGRTYAANLTLAAAMVVTLSAAHIGLARFYPILGSKGLAEAINQTRQADPKPNALIILDGELTSGSTLIFYTGQQVHLVNGRVNGLWYGSFWPDAPHIFETESSLRRLWAGPRRIFLFTYQPAARTRDLTPFAPVNRLITAGGKTILTNR